MQVRQSVPVLFAFALAGCMKPNPLIYTLGEDSTGSETGDGDPGDGDSGDGDSGETEAPPMDMPSSACEPFAEPFEPSCGECLALGCCDLALECAEVDECLCLADCLLGGGNTNQCKSQCGGVKPNEVAPLQPLLDCADAHCAQEC